MAEAIVPIPFYPAAYFEKRDAVSVFWFEKDFSQISYGPNVTQGRGGHACLLIGVLMANKVAQRGIHAPEVIEAKPPFELVTAFAEAILQGTEIYGRLLEEQKLKHPNLNVPEAFQACGGKAGLIHEWKSYLYVVDMADNLYNYIEEGRHSWLYKSPAKSKTHLFILLIADNRAVLFILDEFNQTATFVDSHPHGITHGACLAQTELRDLRQLCRWICKMFADLYHSTPTCFELSYLQVKSK